MHFVIQKKVQTSNWNSFPFAGSCNLGKFPLKTISSLACKSFVKITALICKRMQFENIQSMLTIQNSHLCLQINKKLYEYALITTERQMNNPLRKSYYCSLALRALSLGHFLQFSFWFHSIQVQSPLFDTYCGDVGIIFWCCWSWILELW